MSDQIRRIDIEQEMRSAYLDYAMSVIVARALPDARDGLKPVQRRILYAMYDMGIRPNSPYKKSARIVGEVLGKYHPHGDAAVYDAMARMAQDFSLRYLLVDGQGNFGSIDGDAPAAMRYTEARLTSLAMDLLTDIDKDTVDWIPNFDGTLMEPEVLPAALPNLLINGASGIAVGMATNIPPHNVGEVIGALDYLLGHWDERDEVSVETLMSFIQGPDFPTGGVIIGVDALRQAYATGRGQLTVRAVAEVEPLGKDRQRIVITEIPYQVNKSSLIERIAELVRLEKLDEISDLRDESDQRGLRIVIELKRGAQPQKTLNRLYRYTPLQSTFSVQLLALVQGMPLTLPLRRLLLIFLEHRIEVLVRRSQYELRRARDRAHILEGLLIALDHLDEVVAIIRQSPDVETARTRLMSSFGLTEVQAQAILDMPLRRLTALEREKLVAEYEELLRTIAHLESLLASPLLQRETIRAELQTLHARYADARRTRIEASGAEMLEDEDFVHHERVLIPITAQGYIKRVPLEQYRAQGRGGKGVIGMTTREEDAVLYILSADTLDTLLFFTDKGRVYQQRVYQIPAADRTAKGSLLAGLLALGADEHVTAVVAVPGFDIKGYLTLVTRQGRIKRVPLQEFATIRTSGLLAMALEEGDTLGWARLTGGQDELILVTEQGQALRFPEEEVRPMGRTAAGVKAITLEEGDAVTSMEVVLPQADFLVVAVNGYGRRTALDEFSLQHRGGKGLRAFKVSARTGPVTSGRVVQESDEVIIISESGQILRARVTDIPRMGRATQGVRLMELKAGDRVASVARLGEN